MKFSYKENIVCNCCRNTEHFLFCVRPLALHHQQPKKDKMLTLPPPGKISADALVDDIFLTLQIYAN